MAALVGWYLVLLIVYFVLCHWIWGVLPTYAGTAGFRTKWLLIAGLSTMPGGIFPAIDFARIEPRVPMAVGYISAAITNIAPWSSMYGDLATSRTLKVARAIWPWPNRPGQSGSPRPGAGRSQR